MPNLITKVNCSCFGDDEELEMRKELQFNQATLSHELFSSPCVEDKVNSQGSDGDGEDADADDDGEYRTAVNYVS